MSDYEKMRIQKLNDFCSGQFPRMFRNSRLSDFCDEIELGCLDSINSGESFFITGITGTGKTRLAVAVLKEIAKKATDMSRGIQGHEIRGILDGFGFENFPMLLQDIKGSFREDSAPMKTIIGKMTVGTRIFDDIVAFKASDIAIETLYLILDQRYCMMKQTIYTSNLSLSEISKLYGDRIASRLASCYQITLTGKDRRIKNA